MSVLQSLNGDVKRGMACVRVVSIVIVTYARISLILVCSVVIFLHTGRRFLKDVLPILPQDQEPVP